MDEAFVLLLGGCMKLGCAAFAFIILSASACIRHAPDKHAEAGNQDLVAALEALDKGDEVRAEKILRNIADNIPSNERAKTVLASLLAKQGGISLKSWLEPLLDSAVELEANAKRFTKNKDMKEDAAATLQSVMSMLSNGSTVFRFVTAMPKLTSEQKEKIREAMYYLRKDMDKVKRSDEAKLYQSILASIFMSNHTRSLANLITTTVPGKYDGAYLDKLRYETGEVKISLMRMSEGLRPESKETGKRMEARKRIADFIDNNLVTKDFGQLEEFLQTKPDEAIAKLKSKQAELEKFAAELKTKFEEVVSTGNSVLR